MSLKDPLSPAPGETLDRLCGDWHIFQLASGHRFSTDDLVAAWAALRARPRALTALDLGAGVGSVGLMVLHQLSAEASLVMVEAQEISRSLHMRSIALNGLEARVRSRLADLRDHDALPVGATFDVITGTPPYIPVGQGLVSPHPQRAHCRMELRGDVFDYAEAAAEALAPDGAFVLVHAARDDRPVRAVAEAGLALRSRQEIHFREGRPASLAVLTSTWEGEREDPPPICVRNTRGRWTDDWREVRAVLGFRERPGLSGGGA